MYALSKQRYESTRLDEDRGFDHTLAFDLELLLKLKPKE